MPTADFGEKLSFSASKFTKLKSKGEKIQFKILGKPFYDGKHFREDPTADKKWDIQPCPRINEGAECSICELFFKAHREAKKNGLDKKETEKLTKDFKPAVSFYFPVLNRVTEQFEVFQTTQGVRNQIEIKMELDSDLLDRDLIVMRTELPGNYYSLDVVDSAKTKPLTDKESEETIKGANVNMDDYVNGRSEVSEDEVDAENIDITK